MAHEFQKYRDSGRDRGHERYRGAGGKSSGPPKHVQVHGHKRQFGGPAPAMPIATAGGGGGGTGAPTGMMPTAPMSGPTGIMPTAGGAATGIMPRPGGAPTGMMPTAPMSGPTGMMPPAPGGPTGIMPTPGGPTGIMRPPGMMKRGGRS